jgi:o-succinylbenzoate synthase
MRGFAGIQPSIPELLAVIERELAAGYQRIKLKCKPGWDTEVFERVRNRWPGIMLSCDANSAYRLGMRTTWWSLTLSTC